MKVKVRLFAHLFELTGAKDPRNFAIDLDEPKVTLRDLIDALNRRYDDGDYKKVISSPRVLVFINGKYYEALAGLDTILQDSDEILITPRIFGG